MSDLGPMNAGAPQQSPVHPWSSTVNPGSVPNSGLSNDPNPGRMVQTNLGPLPANAPELASGQAYRVDKDSRFSGSLPGWYIPVVLVIAVAFILIPMPMAALTTGVAVIIAAGFGVALWLKSRPEKA